MHHVFERYNPLVIPVSTAIKTTASGMGGFLCVTAGTLTVATGDGTTIISALPVTAGTFYPMPFRLHHNISNGGATITTAGGASGVLGIS